MAFSAPWKLDKLVLPGGVEFTQIGNMRWGAEIQSMVERPAGHPHPMFTAVQTQKPVLEFSTSQIGVLLAACGVGGAAVGSTASYFKLAAATGSVARATTSHKKVTIASSLLHWSTITLPHNGRAEANCTLTAIYDGTNNPFAYAGSQALSGNLTATTYFGAGPVEINGTEIPGIQSIEVSSGVRLLQVGEASEVWDRFVGVEMTEPVVTIRTLDFVNWGVILDLDGIALDGSTGIEFYARKYTANGTRVANATTEHIKFVGALGHAVPVDSSGQESGMITDTLRCQLVSASDSVAPLTGSVGVAIAL